jgi:tetratricopeptide (TPR) repeat protein
MHSSSDYEKAIGAYSSCIQMDSSNARAFLCRGISYECINNMDAAVADYTKAIALLPEDGKAYYMRGMLLWRLCDGMAINDLEKSVELHYKPARDFLSKKTSQRTKCLSVNKIYFLLILWYRFSRMTSYVTGRNHGHYRVLGSFGCVLGQGGAADPSAGT